MKKTLKQIFNIIVWPFKKFFGSKKAVVITSIIMSYAMSYVAPVFIIYVSTRNKFFREEVVGPRISLRLIGFIVVIVIFILVFLIRMLIKAIKAKPSYIKYSFLLVLWVLAIGTPVYFLIKLYNFTFILEAESGQFFNSMRSFIVEIKNGLLIFLGCLTLSTIFKFIAIRVDREYVHKLDWL